MNQKIIPLRDAEAMEEEKRARKRRDILPLVRVSDVPMKAIRWLWPDRIALGKLTLIAGTPGIGKSLLTADIAARVTRGTDWPAGEGRAPAGSVVMLAAEDAIDDGSGPRLVAAGADIAPVHALDAGEGGPGSRSFDIRRDIARLEAACEEIGDVRLIVVDPITEYLGNKDANAMGDIRSILGQLRGLAVRQDAAVLVVHHLNKGGSGDPMNRIAGSGAFVAAARIAFLAVRDAEANRTLLLQVKSNAGRQRDGLAYSIVGRKLPNGIETASIEWDSAPVTMTAAEALAGASAEPEERSARKEAEDFLRAELANGPLPANEINRRAEAQGIKRITLRRARERLGINPQKGAFGGGWTWSLPSEGDHSEPKMIKMITPREQDHLDHLGPDDDHLGGFDTSGDGEEIIDI